MRKRPISITIISWIYIAAGIVGIAYHAREFNLQHPFEDDAMLALFVRALAIIGGTFMLRGQNWARWLTLAWMGCHVYLSIYHSRSQLVTHAAFLVVLAYFLFRPQGRDYFLRAHDS